MPIQKPSRYYGVLTNKMREKKRKSTGHAIQCNTMRCLRWNELPPHMMRRKGGGEKKGRRLRGKRKGGMDGMWKGEGT